MKQRANSVNSKAYSYENTELNRRQSLKCVETIYSLPSTGNDIVHSLWKHRGKV